MLLLCCSEELNSNFCTAYFWYWTFELNCDERLTSNLVEALCVWTSALQITFITVWELSNKTEEWGCRRGKYEVNAHSLVTWTSHWKVETKSKFLEDGSLHGVPEVILWDVPREVLRESTNLKCQKATFQVGHHLSLVTGWEVKVHRWKTLLFPLRPSECWHHGRWQRDTRCVCRRSWCGKCYDTWVMVKLKDNQLKIDDNIC